MVERVCTLVKTLQLYMRHEWILSQFYVEVFLRVMFKCKTSVSFLTNFVINYGLYFYR